MYLSRITYLFILFMMLSQSVFSQQTIYDEATFVYKKELNGGIHLHLNGIGLYLNKSHQKTVNNHQFWGIDLASMKHPKELKRYNPVAESSKGYFYGKKNALILLRPTVGKKKIVSEKYRKNGISFSKKYSIGPSIGFLKPVYIKYRYHDEDGFLDNDVEEQFDITKHTNLNDILGRSSFFKGIQDTKTVIGVHIKYGLDFEYSPYQTGVKGLEFGLSLDAFAQPVEIMDFNTIKNKNLFLSFYFNFYIGKKYNNIENLNDR